MAIALALSAGWAGGGGLGEHPSSPAELTTQVATLQATINATSADVGSLKGSLDQLDKSTQREHQLLLQLLDAITKRR